MVHCTARVARPRSCAKYCNRCAQVLHTNAGHGNSASAVGIAAIGAREVFAQRVWDADYAGCLDFDFYTPDVDIGVSVLIGQKTHDGAARD